VCDAAGDHSHERFIAVVLHDRRVSFTLAKFSVDARFSDNCALGETITAAIERILKGESWPDRNE
jgi:hypothetical protein